MAKTIRGVLHARLTPAAGHMLNMSFDRQPEELKQKLEK